jgi:hypothetical protein
MKLRQVHSPAAQAFWIEHFYNGELKVVNGEVETDNQTWINLLYQRGFRPIDEVNEEFETVGEVYVDEGVEPLGTQIAAQVENECDQEKIDALVDESREKEEELKEEESQAVEVQSEPLETPKEEKAEDTKEITKPDDPFDALKDPSPFFKGAPPKKPRPSRRKTT